MAIIITTLNKLLNVNNKYNLERICEIFDAIIDDTWDLITVNEYFVEDENSSTYIPVFAGYMFETKSLLEYLEDEETREYLGESDYNYIVDFIKYVIDNFGHGYYHIFLTIDEYY